jgi:hypothetical protein
MGITVNGAATENVVRLVVRNLDGDILVVLSHVARQPQTLKGRLRRKVQARVRCGGWPPALPFLRGNYAIVGKSC